MDSDTLICASKSIQVFLTETYPHAIKGVSSLCEALIFANPNSLDMIMCSINSHLENESQQTIAYRVRILARTVRYSGKELLRYRKTIVSILKFALSSSNKHVFKCGCKLLRHTLYSQSECYLHSTAYYPERDIGKMACLRNGLHDWHTPSGEQVDFCVELVQYFMINPMEEAVSDTKKIFNNDGTDDRQLLMSWRRVLKITRYIFRGMANLFLDFTDSEKMDTLQEKAISNMLSSASESTLNFLRDARKKVSIILVNLMNLAARDIEINSSEVKPNLFFADIKILKEITSLSTMLLSRHGAKFRVTEEQNMVQGVADRCCLDYTLLGYTDHITWTLQRSGIMKGRIYEEGGFGRIIPTRLLSHMVFNLYASIQRSYGHRWVFRLKEEFQTLSLEQRSRSYFSGHLSGEEVLECMKDILSLSKENVCSLSIVTGFFDGLCALCCHSKRHVGFEALKAISNLSVRFAWAIRGRTDRLIDGINLADDKVCDYGVPSCAKLSEKFDHQGKRKQFAQAINGVCNLLSLKPCIKAISTNQKIRNKFIRAFCRTDRVIELMPAEDVPQLSYLLYEIFRQIRSGWMVLPRSAEIFEKDHKSCLQFLVEQLVSDKKRSHSEDISEINDDKKHEHVSFESQHWRNRLFIAWFLLQMIDYSYIERYYFSSEIMEVTSTILKGEKGQPLQLTPIGMMGKSVSLLLSFQISDQKIREKMTKSFESQFLNSTFVERFCVALSYNHKQAGDHNPQWAHGVTEVLRDVGHNMAGAILYPMQRTGRASGLFSLTHVQLIENIFSVFTLNKKVQAAEVFLAIAHKLAVSPPCEDQAKLQCTAVEIFTGVCRSLMLSSLTPQDWENKFCLSFLDEILPGFPLSLQACFYDGIRYVIHSCSFNQFQFLTDWIVTKIERNLWQSGKEGKQEANVSTSDLTDGFAYQLKLLTIMSSVLIEVDAYHSYRWYEGSESKEAKNSNFGKDLIKVQTLQIIFNRLLPCIVDSVGHPYERCRGSIAGLMYRICQINRKLDQYVSLNMMNEIIIALEKHVHEKSISFQEECHSRITIGKLILTFLRWGDTSFYCDFILRILPLAFESMTLSERTTSDSAQLLLDAEVVKIFRNVLAEVASIHFIPFGRETDINKVLESLEFISNSPVWQIRQVVAHFLRCFHSCHRFKFTISQTESATNIVATLLADERREVSSAALAALIGILAITPADEVFKLVESFKRIANASIIRGKRVKKATEPSEDELAKETKRAQLQQKSVYILCAAILSRPYSTPNFVPIALKAISQHSFERRASLAVRETVKKCCSEYKRTHIDQWQAHRRQFNQEQLEALDDVVSTPHYYA